MPAILQVTC